MKKLFGFLLIVGLSAAPVHAGDVASDAGQAAVSEHQVKVNWLWEQVVDKHPYLSSSVVAVATFFWFMKDNVLFMEKWNSLFGKRRPRAFVLDDACRCVVAKGYCDCGPNTAGCPCAQVAAPVEKAVKKPAKPKKPRAIKKPKISKKEEVPAKPVVEQEEESKEA